VRTADNFRKDLKVLYDKGYRLVSLRDYIENNIKVEAGYTPFVLTFDDGAKNNFNIIEENGEKKIDPNCAVGILEEFKKENPTIYSSRGATKGQLKAEYQTANIMTNSLENDENCMKFLDGEKEVIIQGELFGIKWRGMVDVLNLEKGFFSDLKTTQGIHKKYGGLTFIEQYGYIEQMAIYRELIKQQFGKDLIPYIVAIEKNNNPLKAIIKVDERYTSPKLEEIEFNIVRIKNVKQGIEQPIGCGECDYCRKVSKVTQIQQ
jgi:hypothetical protein